MGALIGSLFINHKAMDEVKTHDECMHGGCREGGHACGEMHQFCHRKCCFIKVLVVTLVVVGIFAAGFCAGAGRGFRHAWHDGAYEGGYREHMMFQNGLPVQIGDWDVNSGATNVRCPMIGGVAPETQAVPTTAVPVTK